VRLVLSAPVAPTEGPERILGRLVELKGRPHLSLTHRHATRDVTQNLPVSVVADWARAQLPGKFRSALLGTTTRDWQLTTTQLISHKAATTEAPTRMHDQTRETILDESARDWLHGLGVIDSAGKVRASMTDKYRQINRYLEILTHLAKPLRPQPIADMGCGKGYLTFGAWHLFRRVWGWPVNVVGVEAWPELVATTSQLARQIGAEGLEFRAGTIESVPLPAVDALIALHACDTATDHAIRRGVAAGAKLIIVAPCCHKEVRPQLGKPAPLAAVLVHGIMAERMAEWATDGLRALFLEAAGYRTKLIEFVASEHTPKNLMIAGIRTGRPGKPENREEFKAFFGIRHHALD